MTYNNSSNSNNSRKPVLYCTGDCHGNFIRLDPDNFPEQLDMTKEDYVVILGDFGGVWSGYKREEQWLDWLNRLPGKVLWCDGNHENMDLLDAYPVEMWHGGKIHKIREHVIHLMRGQVFEIAGKKIFIMGGGKSHDIDGGIFELDDPNRKTKCRGLDLKGIPYRTNHLDWWSRELPSEEEMQEGLANLAKHDWKVDYIFSHCPPTEILKIMDEGRNKYKPDYLTDYLQQIADKCDFKLWLFGHMHCNWHVADQYVCLYEQIVKVW